MRPVFLGTEASQAPEVVELVALARRVGAGLGPRATGALSLRNGLRHIQNVGDRPFQAVGLSDFVEVADYDPLTGQIFCLGTRTPGGDAPLHAMLFRAKAEIACIAQVPLPKGAELEVVERDPKPLNVAAAMLRCFRETDAVALDNDAFVVAPTLPKLARRLDALLASGPADAPAAAAPHPAPATDLPPGPGGAFRPGAGL